MKGIIIYENDLRAINAVKLKNASFCYESVEDDKTDTLQGTPVICASATCNKEDTYDFETGALIALMKMCGSDKVVRACNEAFSYETDIKVLRKDNNNLREANKGLQEEVKRLKGESESHWKKYQRNIQKKQDRINELNNIEEEYIKLREEYDSLFEENEKLQHEYNLCKNSENALKCSVDYLNKTIAKLNAAIHGYKEDLYKVTKRCEELEIKESTLNKQQEQLDKREEKISVYFGGRGNGKQYKALVELFKKLPKDKVQAAYVAAYKESLIWCTSQPSIRDSLTVDSLIEQSRAFTRKCVDEWLCKPHTKREEMWEKILEASKCPPVEIKVAKQNITTFLRELQDKIPEVMWNGSDCPPIENIVPYWFKHDYIYFALLRNVDKGKLKLCYNDEHHSWIKTTIDYLPPMRWDLFKKGRIAVKVTYNNYKEFYEACEKELGKKPSGYPMLRDDVTISICKKDGNFEIFTMEDQKKTGRKIVNWEDVR